MGLESILKELREQRERVEEVIIALERVQHGNRRRGRRPEWMKAATAGTGAERKTRRALKKSRKSG